MSTAVLVLRESRRGESVSRVRPDRCNLGVTVETATTILRAFYNAKNRAPFGSRGRDGTLEIGGVVSSTWR